ncbi:MAG: hypothetical protein WC595_00760 [Candidatus Nanoarchaeia archaeon]
MKANLLLVMFLLVISSVTAAEIHGTIYSASLSKVKNVVVEVDSSPVQRLVAKEGEYGFSVPAGRDYTIIAKVNNSKVAEERISVKADGSYVIDLFIFPEFEDEVIEEIVIDDPLLEESLWEGGSNSSWIVILIILGLIGIAGARFIIKRKPDQIKKELLKEEMKLPSKNDLDKIIELIKSEGGRMNQKELRKHFPLSEAKVSLMIAELESKGKIEKIKKGRGNILVLK